MFICCKGLVLVLHAAGGAVDETRLPFWFRTVAARAQIIDLSGPLR